MKGLELSRLYYEEFGRQMIHSDFNKFEKFIAVGLVGSGSECFGFDDEVSIDHDFEPCFCMFIPGEDIISEKDKFLLERAYAKLPKEFLGYKRQMINPVGGARRGVIRTSDFYESKIGRKDGFKSGMEWFNVSDFYIAEAINGEIFRDDYGEFTKIRESLKHMPQDVKLKKLAGNLLIMAQSGQYNYYRMIQHKETAASQLSIFEFVQHAMNVMFLLNDQYIPYYKWSFKALRNLNQFSELYDVLEFLITSDNNGKSAKVKAEIIEDVSAIIIEKLKDLNFTSASCNDLEKHAYSVNDKIKDSKIRNLNILYAI